MSHRQPYLNNHNAINTLAYACNSKPGKNHIKTLFQLSQWPYNHKNTANSHLNTWTSRICTSQYVNYCAFHQVRGLKFFKLQWQFEISNNKMYLAEKLVFSRSWRYSSADHCFKIKPTIGKIVYLHSKFPSDFVYPEASISGSR